MSMVAGWRCELTGMAPEIDDKHAIVGRCPRRVDDECAGGQVRFARGQAKLRYDPEGIEGGVDVRAGAPRVKM